MKVFEYANGEPQVCGALSAIGMATLDTARPALLTAANPPALISRDLRSAWRACGVRSALAERALVPSMRHRQSASTSQLDHLYKTPNWIHESPVVHFKVFALSLVCAVIGPAAAVVLFVLLNNN